VRAVRTAPVIRPVLHLAMLSALTATVGLNGSGWVVGIACGVAVSAALVRGLDRSGSDVLGPADQVTFVRATLVGGIAALTAASFTETTPVTALVALVVVALVLDAVDGWVARHTQSVSALGARFDMEVDAFLMLVLSVYVARSTGWWVLAIGTARYAFVAAGWLLPWLRGSLPPRYWCKVVAATQGIVLAFATAAVLPRWLTDTALAVSLALLTESFGREVWWLWRHQPLRTIEIGAPVGSSEPGCVLEPQWQWQTVPLSPAPNGRHALFSREP
jgi:phosphatidylglycerophosphate synthase